MTITREQVADLRPGDVVELTWADGTTLRGPVTERYNPAWLYLGPILLRTSLESWRESNVPDGATLTVVSRAPRPLYVNSDRGEPVPGDVVRVETGKEDDHYTDIYLPRDEADKTPWVSLAPDEIGFRYSTDEALCWTPRQGRNLLLIDGSTGLPPAVSS